MYRSFSASNSINEDNNNINNLLNKINDLENDNESSLDLFNNHSSYRLGDGFYLTNESGVWINNKKHSIHKNNIPLEELSETYSNSILSQYLKLSNYTEKDWDTLIEIVNNKFYRDININKSTDCLMHVRVGDVIDELCSGQNFLNKFYKNINKRLEEDKSKIIRCNYVKTLKYFQQKIKKLIEMGITKVYLMAGAHIKLPSYKYSIYYINKIVEEIEKAGLQVELKLGGSPDDDLLFSINFDYFISSEGQYCRLITELNQKINPDFKII
jgi:hypothetical protein